MKSMSMKSDMMMGRYHMWHGFKKILFGGLLLLNAYQPFMDPWALVGLLFVLWGFSKLMMPGYGCCGNYR